MGDGFSLSFKIDQKKIEFSLALQLRSTYIHCTCISMLCFGWLTLLSRIRLCTCTYT